MNPDPPAPPAGWRAWLALNASTGALLAAVLLIGMSNDLWSPLMPKYLDRLQASILLIGLYGTARDFLEAVTYYFGGALAARFNTRRALLLFNALPIAGLTVLLLWQSKYAVFVALPFVGIWDSIAGPATLRVIGASLSEQRRTMAISLQSIQKRISRLLAYTLSGGLVLLFGEAAGVRTGVGVALVLVLISLAVQYRYMQTAVADEQPGLAHPIRLLRQFSPPLRRLLWSDILIRWCEGLPRELIILYSVSLLLRGHTSDVDVASAFYVSVLLVVMNGTSLALYLPVGHAASKPGAGKKPYIGLSFVFFALFPLALLALGPSFGAWGLVMAFVIGGLRELGEPARKALITELVPPGQQTQAIGVYWSARCLAVMLAPITGACLWYFAGPEVLLLAAGGVGIVGAGLFYLRFGEDEPEASATGDRPAG